MLDRACATRADTATARRGRRAALALRPSLRREFAIDGLTGTGDSTTAGDGLPPTAGVLLCAKPIGVTSHDVVATLRRRFGRATKLGHAGTLDPFATGLLLVLLGQATRAQRFFVGLPKRYRAVARLGWKSDTGDRDGVLEQTGRIPERLSLPTGRILQRPPAYSAVRVGGERLYHKARRGEPVEGAEREVTVYRFDVLWREPERVGLEIECSAGTYVRQLVVDLGDAYCEELERTRIGSFRLEDAASPETLEAKCCLPLGQALGFLPELSLDADEARRVGHGVAVRTASAGESAEAVRLTYEGRLVALARPQDGELKPIVVLSG